MTVEKDLTTLQILELSDTESKLLCVIQGGTK